MLFDILIQLIKKELNICYQNSNLNKMISKLLNNKI